MKSSQNKVCISTPDCFLTPAASFWLCSSIVKAQPGGFWVFIHVSHINKFSFLSSFWKLYFSFLNWRLSYGHNGCKFSQAITDFFSVKWTQDGGERLLLWKRNMFLSLPLNSLPALLPTSVFSNRHILNLRQIFRSLDGAAIKGPGCVCVRNVFSKTFDSKIF